MMIAIDYDGTFTADVEMWQNFVADANRRGHKCVCVTGRSDIGEFGAEVRRQIGSTMPIVFAGSQWKREAAKASGFNVDVWIDDVPWYIAEQQILFSQCKQQTT